MRILHVNADGNDMIIITSSRFDGFDEQKKLEILQKIIFDLRTIYGDMYKEFRLNDLTNKKTKLQEIKKLASDRRMLAYKYREEGMTFQEIGDHFGISNVRARAMVLRAKKDLEKEELK